jgi:hypothetical protein
VKGKIGTMELGLISRCAFEGFISAMTTATATATKTTLHHFDHRLDCNFDHRVDTGISQPVVSGIVITHCKTYASAFG